MHLEQLDCGENECHRHRKRQNWKGDTKFWRSGKLLALTRYDKRQVSMLSIMHDASIVHDDRNTIVKPRVILEWVSE